MIDGDVLARAGTCSRCARALTGTPRSWCFRDIALETAFQGALVDAMSPALQAEDADAVAIPYMMPGGTDANAFAPFGIRCFGFSPLRLLQDLDLGALFDGVDERVRVDGPYFGERVPNRFLLTA